VRYEDRLRALGAYADEGNWRTLRLFEVADRVFLQGRSPADGDLVECWLAEEDLDTLFSRLARRRSRGRGWRDTGPVPGPGAAAGSPPVTMLGRLRRQGAPLPQRLGTNYEDVLRALGHLADQVRWYDLRVFELGEGLLLQGRPSRVPDALVLASRAFTDADLRELLRASYARRRRPGPVRLQPPAPPDPTPPTTGAALPASPAARPAVPPLRLLPLLAR
jgi:hypothetical protein